MMYRDYENPHELSQRLEELKIEYNTRTRKGENPDNLMELAIEINELEERINLIKGKRVADGRLKERR